MRLSIFLISLTAPRAAAFQSPQAPRPRTRRHSTPPDDGTFGSDGPMMAADPDAEFAALEAMAQATAAPAAAPQHALRREARLRARPEALRAHPPQ